MIMRCLFFVFNKQFFRKHADARWFTFEEIKVMQDKLRHIRIVEVIKKYEKDFKNFI